MTKRTHQEAQHAMQTGVKMELEALQSARADWHEKDHKDLRVGSNTALCDQAGLVRLLVAKGLITIDEYENAITQEMAREVERYEKRLSRDLGTTVTLV